MSAITGIFYRDGRKVDPELIKKMNNRLSHRGPDGAAVWCEESVAFGHQMLWTTPESLHEKLPFEDNDSELVITADARIDNRDELSKELDIKDKEDVSDSYFILKAYERWGENCSEYLLGDFVFVIWDKNEEKLFCARDHMGVRPFYYYLDDNAFFFATEIKALLKLPEIPIKLNKVKIACHLVGLFEDREITFYNDILRLPAATNLVVGYDNKKFGKYWELDLNKNIIMDSDEDYAAAFLDIFEEAVRCRLRSAFPIGFQLSGGLDSSSVVCTAKKILAEKSDLPLKTYSATFDNTPECDEQYYINEVVNFGNFEPQIVKADKISPLSEKDDMIWNLDEPISTPNLYIRWHIHQMAGKNGTRIILDGLDGDTTVSHGGRFATEYFLSMKWIKAFKGLYCRSKRIKASFRTLFLLTFLLPLTPEFILRIIELLHINTKGIVTKFDLINENLAKETDIIKIVKQFEEKDRSARSSKSYHHLKLNQGILQYVLEIVDKSAAAGNLDARYPFFDRRLIEFCLALPVEQKINEGWDRIIMRRAMQDILPKKIQWRPTKTSLGPNFQKNLLLFEKSLLEDVIFNQNNLIEEYVDLETLSKIYSDYSVHGRGRATEIFMIATLVIWLQTNVKLM